MPYTSKYSFMKGLGKLGENIGEILIAILVAILPQLIEILAGLDPATLHIPPQWAFLWYAAIRLLRNWWKNRN